MTFRDAKEQAIKSVEALAECYDEVQRELIAARITIEQLNAELHPTRRLKLPTDPDVEPAVEPENKDEEMSTPTVKPYGQNGEDKCLKCGHPATHALVTRLCPLELLSFVCRKHAIGGTGRHAISMRQFLQLQKDQAIKQ